MWGRLTVFSLDDFRSVFHRKENSVTWFLCHSFQSKSGINRITISLEWKDQKKFVWDFFLLFATVSEYLVYAEAHTRQLVTGVISGWTLGVLCYSCGFDPNVMCMYACIFLFLPIRSTSVLKFLSFGFQDR